MISRVIFAILPVIFKYAFQELVNYWHNRNKDEIKKNLKEMNNAIKSDDIERINELFNATKLRNKERKAGSEADKL